MEIWLPCEGYPDYEVNSDGEMRMATTGNAVRPRQNAQGVSLVNIWCDSLRSTRSVALIVAQAYLRPPPNPRYNSVIHLDGDKSNCQAINLMWRPRWFTVKYHQMFNEDPYNVSVYIVETGETFPLLRDACVKYGLIEKDTYQAMVNGQRCFHYGYEIRRVEEY